MKKKKVLLIGGVAVIVVVIVILNLTMSTTTSINVQAEEASTKRLVETVSASGRIQPKTKVNITAEITGEIISLHAHEGDFVNPGDLLVVLDTVQARSDADQARYAVREIEARLTGSKATLDQAKEEHDRQEKLFKDKLTSETERNAAKYAYLNAKSTYEATLAQAEQLRSRYDKQLDNLSKTKIVAPMPGIITFLDCEVGEIAPAQTAFTQGKTLMTIADLSVFEVEVEVDETEINKILLGQSTEIEVDAFPDTTFAGEVVEIGNTAILSNLGTQEQSTNFKVKVVFQDPDVLIRPGMSATVDVTTELREEALAIPYSAVVMRTYDLDSLERARAGNPESETEDSGETQLQAAEGTESEMEEVDTLEDDTVTTEEDTDTTKSEEPEREDIKGVFVIQEGQARFVPIKTGIADKQDIEVHTGIVEGDSVVSGPYSVLRTIKDGEHVQVE